MKSECLWDLQVAVSSRRSALFFGEILTGVTDLGIIKVEMLTKVMEANETIRETAARQ